jgi:hypothetical protein
MHDASHGMFLMPWVRMFDLAQKHTAHNLCHGNPLGLGVWPPNAGY